MSAPTLEIVLMLGLFVLGGGVGLLARWGPLSGWAQDRHRPPLCRHLRNDPADASRLDQVRANGQCLSVLFPDGLHDFG
jgi:hypothetical protein